MTVLQPYLEKYVELGRFSYGKSTDELWFVSASSTGSDMESLAPLVSFRWDLSAGTVRLTPPSVEDAVGLDRRFIDDYGSAWSAGRRFYAYWSHIYDSKAQMGMGDGPLTRLAVTGTNPADKIYGLLIQPNPGPTQIIWTPQQMLLYAYSPNSRGGFAYPPTRGQQSRFYSPTYNYWCAPTYNYWPPLTSASNFPLQQFWPSIYEAGVTAAKGEDKVAAKRLIANAFAPNPSPDGRYIAFIGWKQNEPLPAPKAGQTPAIEPSEPQWWLWDRQTKTRTLISSRPVFAIDAAWSGDSRTLYFNASPGYRSYQDAAKRPATPEKADIFALDVAALMANGAHDATAATKALGQISVAPAKSPEDFQPDFRLRGQTHDGKYLLLDSLEFGRIREAEQAADHRNPRDYSTTSTIHALRLSDGQDEVVARLKNVESYDWFDLSTPAR